GGGWDASLLIDGRTDRGWSSFAGQTANQVVIIALAGGGSNVIDRVRVDGSSTEGGPPADGLRDFEVRVSTTDLVVSSFPTVCSGTAPQASGWSGCLFP